MTAVVPTSGSRSCLQNTLDKIRSCNPAPAQVIVHLDEPPSGMQEVLRKQNPNIKILESATTLGPGGGRGRLITAASHELVASFDDDSFPETSDYFARAWQTAGRFPDAAVISAASPGAEREMPGFMSVSVYSGCGCVFRRSWFLKVPGFVPLPVAYGMEEVDLSLQLSSMGGVIVHDPHLHVRHDHPEGELRDVKQLNAVVLANTMLFPWLRYPAWLLPIGVAQVANRLLWALRNRETRGLLRGLWMMPGYLWKYRQFRHVAPARSIKEWFKLRRQPRLLATDNSGVP